MIQIITIFAVFVILTALFSLVPHNRLDRVQQEAGAGNQPNCGSNFDNFCLTQRPRGFQQSLCTWWRDFRDTRLDRPGRPDTKARAFFAIGNNNNRFINIDNHTFPFPTQLDGYDLDVHDPFKKNFPPKKDVKEPLNPVIWNRIGVDQPLDKNLVGGGPTNEPLSKIISKKNWPNLPFFTQPEFTSYHPDYFNNSSSFCMENPRHRLCPNHWKLDKTM